MKVFLNAAYEAMIDKSPNQVVMALFIALAGALVIAQIYAFISRKASDPQVILTGLLVFGFAVATVLGVGLERYTRELSSPKQSALIPRSTHRHAHSSLDVQIVRRILELADSDKDGRLSPEEASQAAAWHVRNASKGGEDESVDFRTLTHLVHYAIMVPPRFPGSPPPPLSMPPLSMEHTNRDTSRARN